MNGLDSGLMAWLCQPLALLGRSFLGLLYELGLCARFFARGLRHMASLPFQYSKTLQQIYFIGAKSVLLIVLIGLFTGMVLGLQGYYTLVKFGAEGLLGPAVALSTIRELGPVLTAIMITGRAGSAMAAEIGIMRISEQIDALKTMDIDPVRFLVGPRFLAGLISFPLLTAIFDVVAMFGGYLTGVKLLGINSGIYFQRIYDSVDLTDVRGGFIKALIFAVLVVGISCFRGYYTHTRPGGFGAKGVSLATTSAVVSACILVLVADYVTTSFLL